MTTAMTDAATGPMAMLMASLARRSEPAMASVGSAYRLAPQRAPTWFTATSAATIAADTSFSPQAGSMTNRGRYFEEKATAKVAMDPVSTTRKSVHPKRNPTRGPPGQQADAMPP